MDASNLVWRQVLRGDPLIGGETFGKQVEHVCARAPFVDQLARHERMAELIKHWYDATELGSHLRRAVQTLDEAARERGLTGRRELLPLLRNKQEALNELGRLVVEPVAEFQVHFDGLLGDPDVVGDMHGEASALARSFELDWRWIPIECVAIFESQLYRELWDVPAVRVRYAPTSPYAPAPDVYLGFQSRPGESAAEVRERFKLWAEQVDQRLADFVPASSPRGSVPRKRAETCYLWGDCFGRHHLHGASIRQLTMEHYGSEERRGDMRRALERAREMLSRRPAEPTRRLSGTEDP